MWLIVIFVLYILWDVLDISISDLAGETSWRNRASRGLTVTVAFTLVFVGVYFGWAANYHEGKAPYHSVVLFDLTLIFVLYVYRVVQEWFVGKVG